MGTDMADTNNHDTPMDYPAHEKNYSGFIRLLKVAMVVTAIITALVIMIISN